MLKKESLACSLFLAFLAVDGGIALKAYRDFWSTDTPPKAAEKARSTEQIVQRGLPALVPIMSLKDPGAKGLHHLSGEAPHISFTRNPETGASSDIVFSRHIQTGPGLASSDELTATVLDWLLWVEDIPEDRREVFKNALYESALDALYPSYVRPAGVSFRDEKDFLRLGMVTLAERNLSYVSTCPFLTPEDKNGILSASQDWQVILDCETNDFFNVRQRVWAQMNPVLATYGLHLKDTPNSSSFALGEL